MELMKRRITTGFVEIFIRVPQEKVVRAKKIIERNLTRAEIDYSLQTDNQNNTDSLALEEVFPDLNSGSAIKGLRYRDNLTQKQLASMIGVKRHHISEMENGKRPVGKEMAKRLAKAMNTNYKVFL